MASHGIARTKQYRTAEQRQQDQTRIQKYRDLEDTIRARVVEENYSRDTFDLSTKLLRTNPEYYTIWNVRRRCLISGIFSRSSDGPSRSRASPSSIAARTGTRSCGDSSTSSSTETPRSLPCRTIGKSGTIASEGSEERKADEPGEDDKKKVEEQQQRHDLKVIKDELMFTVPLLMEFPKCYWIWNHRLWILNQAIALLVVPAARQIWQRELDLASKMLTKDRRNFHAWGYRRQVVAQLEDPALAGQSMVESEFHYTTAKIREDLSNFSAWHNRSQLIPRLLDERDADDAARTTFLENELEFIQGGVNVGPEDQSLWYYHQFLILNIVSKDAKQSFVPHLTAAERLAYLAKEVEDIKDLLEDYVDIKWIYEALLECILAKATIKDIDEDEKEEVKGWLAKLRELDPMREGRWSDAARVYKLE